MATKGFNLIINDLKKDMINLINQSGLPISIIEMIVSNIANEVSNASAKTLEKEKQDYQNELEKEKQEQEQYLQADRIESGVIESAKVKMIDVEAELLSNDTTTETIQ